MHAAGDRVDQLRNYGAYLLPGVLVMATQAPAIAVGISIVWDRQTGFCGRCSLRQCGG